MDSYCSNLLNIFGILFIAYIVHHVATPILLGIYRHFIRPGKNLQRTYGSWGLITGSTDGIGLALAYELASKGINLIFISRSQTKLQSVSEEIKQKYSNCDIRIFAIDFTEKSESLIVKLTKIVNENEINILINNVGQSYSYPQYYHELSLDTIQSMINVNIQSMTILTHLFVKKVQNLRNEKKINKSQRFAVMNISSFASLHPDPLLSQYSAVKSYIDSLSKSLSLEYSKLNIDFQTQNPLFITTKLAKIRKSSLTIPTPKIYAKCSLRFLGYEKQVSPYFMHSIQTALSKWLPEHVYNSYVFNLHAGMRKRGLQREQEKINGNVQSNGKHD